MLGEVRRTPSMRIYGDTGVHISQVHPGSPEWLVIRMEVRGDLNRKQSACKPTKSNTVHGQS